MGNLWIVPTRALSPGAGLVVWDGLVFVAVAASTSNIFQKRNIIWPEYIMLQDSFICLSM